MGHGPARKQAGSAAPSGREPPARSRAWLVLAAPGGIARIACIYVVTFLIGLGGFHHAIAGAVEAFSVLFVTGSLDILTVLQFLALTVLGNIIGGSVFVALLNYGHIRKTQISP